MGNKQLLATFENKMMEYAWKQQAGPRHLIPAIAMLVSSRIFQMQQNPFRIVQ